MGRTWVSTIAGAVERFHTTRGLFRRGAAPAFIIFVVMAWCPWGHATSFGPATLPGWASEAQTRVGWQFIDPTAPGGTDLVGGWTTYVGAAEPEWTYDAVRTVGGSPAQWYLDLSTNVAVPGESTRFWVSYIYDRDNTFQGPRVFTNLDLTFDSVTFVGSSDQWLTASGTPTADSYSGVYGRYTFEYLFTPSVAGAEIWLGVTGSGGPFNLREAYILTQNTPSPYTPDPLPEPASFAILGLGLAGAGARGWLRRRSAR